MPSIKVVNKIWKKKILDIQRENYEDVIYRYIFFYA